MSAGSRFCMAGRHTSHRTGMLAEVFCGGIPALRTWRTPRGDALLCWLQRHAVVPSHDAWRAHALLETHRARERRGRSRVVSTIHSYRSSVADWLVDSRYIELCRRTPEDAVRRDRSRCSSAGSPITALVAADGLDGDSYVSERCVVRTLLLEYQHADCPLT